MRPEPTPRRRAPGATSRRLVIGAGDMGWLARFLLGLSMPFEVEDPPELRSELAPIGEELTRRYAKPSL